MTEDEKKELLRMAEVMRQAAEGKRVEERSRQGSAWHSCLDPSWAWDVNNYRIARQPREWWILRETRTPEKVYERDQEHFLNEAHRLLGGEKVLVREVLDTEPLED